MTTDERTIVELPALDQLQALGWTYLHGADLSPDASPERQHYRDVVLEHRLTAALQRINPWISEENRRKVIRDLRFQGVEHPTLIETNQTLWETLVHTISVEQDLGKGRKGQTVKIIDFENPDNNEFLCVNQYKIEGSHQSIIPDIVLFVNGLPLAVIECKSPYITNPMEAGINQLLRYANRRQPHENEGAERLFWYNQIMVSTHRDQARVGTISSHMEHYLEWKDPYPLTPTQVVAQLQPDAANQPVFAADREVADQPSRYGLAHSQQILIAGLFHRHHFLDLIQNFTVFETIDGRTVKKLARYQQYRAVHKTLHRLKTGKTRKEKGGVIWHTQGSGKSLTMVFLAVKLRRDPKLRDYKLVFITDRTQLDQQLTHTFTRTQGETVYHADSVAHLKEQLSKDSSDLVTAMMQKFQDGEDQTHFPVLNQSDRIIVLADEAHRTQYGTLGVAINASLPNAPKIAFTGTPLIKSRKTHNEFGSYIDQYTIEQSVKDGATVQILYEGREAQTHVTGDSLDQLFEAYFHDKTEQEKAAIKHKYGTERAVLEAPQRIRWVCIDLLKHYQEHIAPNGFKAMIVTPSRRAAVLYKQTLDELGAPPSACVISGAHNDEAFYTPYTDPTQQKHAIDNFKKPTHPLSFLVVKDMLLTGFDAPVCQVMYLDRTLKEHALLQAIARVNRTAAGKTRGFIVDYYGLSDDLTEALAMFSTEDVAGALKDVKEEIPRLQAAHTRVMQHFNGVDKNDIDACVLALADAAIRQSFESDLKRFCKQMDILMPDPAVQPYLADLKFLGKVNLGAKNLYRDAQLDLAGVGAKVQRLIEEHIRATGVDPKIPPVDLFAVDFKEKVNVHKSSRAKASELEYAIKHHIDIHLDDDPEYYKSLSDKLKAILQKHQEHWDELVQQLMNFRDTIETNRAQQAGELGLSETQFAFHNILIAEIARLRSNESVDEATHEEVIAVTKDIVNLLEEATDIVDFFKKQDEIKRMKKTIKRRIVGTSFDDPAIRTAVMDRFMELAKVKYKA